MTDTRDDLLQSVLENPADDLPRLVYADWMEENGEVDHAEFVRVQVALAKEPKTISRTYDYGITAEASNPRYAALKSREQELLYYPKYDWLGVIEELHGAWRAKYENESFDAAWITDDNGTMIAANFSRGFISAITLPSSALHHMPAILAQQPIEQMTVDGVEFKIWDASNGSKYPWRVSGSDTSFNSWPTRSALVAGLVQWIESVLPRGRVEARYNFPTRTLAETAIDNE